jgi:His/Glu/Gln/Arg/opine family amino acid ABC transporter permease subunit
MEASSTTGPREPSLAISPSQEKHGVWRQVLGLVDVPSVVLTVAIATALYHFIDWSQVRTLDFGIVLKYWRPLTVAAGMTILITLSALALGLLLGVGLAILLELPVGPLRYIINAYIEVWRNTPLIVQLFWIHFGLPVVTGISTTALESGSLALTLQSSAYLADIARAGIQAVPRGQWDAVKALALPARTKWFEVILPQALKIMIPPRGNLAVSFLNGSALLGVLSVGELMTVSAKVSDYTSRPVEIMTVTALLYLAINLLTGHLTGRLERLSGRRP